MNINSWNNKTIKIDYICSYINKNSYINKKIVDYIYTQFNNFSNNLYKIWQIVIKDLIKAYKDFDWKNKYCQLYLNFYQNSKFLWIFMFNFDNTCETVYKHMIDVATSAHWICSESYYIELHFLKVLNRKIIWKETWG